MIGSTTVWSSRQVMMIGQWTDLLVLGELDGVQVGCCCIGGGVNFLLQTGQTVCAMLWSYTRLQMQCSVPCRSSSLCHIGAERQERTAATFKPRPVNFFRYPARDLVELLVTKTSFFPCSCAAAHFARLATEMSPSGGFQACVLGTRWDVISYQTPQKVQRLGNALND